MIATVPVVVGIVGGVVAFVVVVVVIVVLVRRRKSSSDTTKDVDLDRKNDDGTVGGDGDTLVSALTDDATATNKTKMKG